MRVLIVGEIEHRRGTPPHQVTTSPSRITYLSPQAPNVTCNRVATLFFAAYETTFVFGLKKWDWFPYASYYYAKGKFGNWTDLLTTTCLLSLTS